MRGPCWTLNHATAGVGRAYPQHQELGGDTVIVHGHSTLTDLLSSAVYSRTGYLVGPRLRAVLEQFALPRHRFRPVPMTHRGKPVDGYCLLQLPAPRLTLAEDMTPGGAEAAILADPALASLDLLRLDRPPRFAYCFVSDPLRRAVEASGVTGARFGTAKLFRAAGDGERRA